MNVVKLSPGYFPNTSASRALSIADIYVGIPDLDPEIVANQKTLSVQQEDGTIVAVSQPIHTNAGGVPVYDGSPVTLLVEGDYSLKVLDSSGTQIYYVPSTAYETYLVAGNYFYPDYSEADQGVVAVGSGSTVTDILAEVGITEKATIYFAHNSGGNTTTYTFTTNTTITDNFDIVVENGVILDGVGTLAINGSFNAGLYRVFGSSITVTFGKGSCDELISEWWGENTTPGTTDLTTPLQNWLNSMYASDMPGFVPSGIHLTGTLTYQGQSFRGVPGSGGYENYTEFGDYGSVILGKDSEDVFYYSVDDNAGSSVFTRGTVIKDIIIVVNDTTDAAASFPNRGGAGNAGIALEHLDGDINTEFSEYNFTFMRSRFQNVAIIGKAFSAQGQNNSIGIYQQGLIYDVTFNQLALGRLEYGFWGDYPGTNITDLEYAPDALKFRDCLIECMNPFRVYNSFNSSINNMQVYGDAVNDKGINILRVASAVRDDTFFWNVIDLYQEIGNTADATGEIGVIEGRNHHFIGGILANTLGDGQYYTWDGDYCVVENIRINSESGSQSLVITGGNNEFRDIVTAYNSRDWFTDSGKGNRISINDSAISSTSSASSRPICQNASRMTYPALSQTSHFAQRLPSTPYYGNEDMFIIPSDINWIAPSTQPTITKDSTVGGSGEYAAMVNPGGQYYFEEVGRVGLDLGYQVPEGKVRIYVMAKMGTSATTQNWNIDVNEVEIDDADLLIGTGWTVAYFDADLSGLTKGHKIWIRAGAPTVNQAWSLAWIAIVPYVEHNLGAHIGQDSGVYDFDVNGGAIGNHILGTLFDNTVITRAWYETITDPTSGGAATIALGVETNDANGIITATAYDNAIWDPGWHDGTPDGTAANFTTQTTANRDVVLAIAGAALTAGKIKVFWEYAVGE